MTRVKLHPSQLSINIDNPAELSDGRPFITRAYDVSRAESAARRRRNRKGELALSMRNRGFMRKAGWLWIPESAAENGDVIHSPEAKLVAEKNFIRLRVQEKYADDDSIDPAKIRRWGYFASGEHEAKSFGKRFNRIIDARKDRVALRQALEPETRTFDSTTIAASSVALNVLADYHATLVCFIGANREQYQRRQWLQERWVKKRAAAREEATAYLSTLQPHELEDFYDEAYFNSWSRELYWQAWFKALQERKLARANQEPTYEPVPLEAYESDPENQCVTNLEPLASAQ